MGTGYRRILVPTDFSSCSEDALEQAVGLAKKYRAQIRLVHIVQAIPAYVEGPVFTPGMVAVYEELEVEARKHLNAVKPKGVRCETVIRRGAPVLEILEESRKYKPDLIVMGTHGRTGLDRLMLGSVAHKVMQHAFCPVLVVKHPVRTRPAARRR